jgi:GNAT superfamily N-acetyltransferase
LTNVQIRLFRKSDSKKVLNLISDIIVNEFKFRLEFDNLDSDLIGIEGHYNKSDGGCFWVAEEIIDKQIISTTGIRNLKQYASTCELKRMSVVKEYRRLGIGQKLLDTAVDFAKRIGYSRILLDSSKYLEAARTLYLKNGFVDIARYNDNHRANIFMEKSLID